MWLYPDTDKEKKGRERRGCLKFPLSSTRSGKKKKREGKKKKREEEESERLTSFEQCGKRRERGLSFLKQTALKRKEILKKHIL